MAMLFDMTDAELNRAVEAHYDRMYEDYYGDSGECCKYCVHYNCPFCTYDDEDQPEKDDDDWCEHFEAEDYYPGEDF